MKVNSYYITLKESLKSQCKFFSFLLPSWWILVVVMTKINQPYSSDTKKGSWVYFGIDLYLLEKKINVCIFWRRILFSVVQENIYFFSGQTPLESILVWNIFLLKRAWCLIFQVKYFAPLIRHVLYSVLFLSVLWLASDLFLMVIPFYTKNI